MEHFYLGDYMFNHIIVISIQFLCFSFSYPWHWGFCLMFGIYCGKVLFFELDLHKEVNVKDKKVFIVKS